MSDIVTDLRTLAAMPEYDRAANMFEQCAAEIERLRAVLAAIALATTPETSTAVKRHVFLDRNIHETARAALANAKPQETE
jgi:hypothetical protein